MPEIQAMTQAITQLTIKVKSALTKTITGVADLVKDGTRGNVTGNVGAKACGPHLKQPAFNWLAKKYIINCETLKWR